MATEATTNPTSNVPEWVQADLFVDVLKETVKDFSKIKSFKANSGSAVGENYATVMLRVNIDVELKDGKEKSISYMLKLPHQTEIFKNLLSNHNIFNVERNMYKIYVPELEQLYRDVGVEVNFGAKSYDLKGAKTDYVLLEDLAPKGFKNTNRLDGLDQTHAEFALRKLAQWHAASAVRVATKGDYPEEITVSFFKEESRAMITEMNNNLQSNFLRNCSTFNGSDVYIEQVKKIGSIIGDQQFKLAKPDPSGFNVLNHGDFWSNNMMFSYDSSGKVKETYIVDLQIAKYGSVTQDLYYFIISSTKLEDKLSKFDYYIRFYYEQLVANLKLLKYTKPIPSLRDIHISLIKYGVWGYLTATGVMSAVLVDPTEAANIENFLSDSDEGNKFKNMLYSNPRYRRHMELILPWLMNRGAFEGI